MIRRATVDELPIVLEIRRVVFVEGQNVPVDRERDGLDDAALHFIVFDGQKPIGTARIRLDGNTGKIERVAVLNSYRGKGIGQDLMRHILDDLRQSGVPKAKLGAQTQAIGFYEALGFSATGPEFMDAGIPHRMMVIDL